MQILYISSLVSNSFFTELYNKGLTTGFSGQKYHSMFAKGLSANEGCTVTALSQPPIAKNSFKTMDSEDGVKFRYVPIIAVPFIKQLIYFIYTAIYTFIWCISNIGKERVIISSLMRIYKYPSVKLGSLLFKCKHITVDCDVPWMTTVQVSTQSLSIKQRIAIAMGKHLCAHFDGYVFLTNTMDSVLNPNHKPSIIVEGFCDRDMENVENLYEEKSEKTVIIYAGGMMKKYGIANLVEAVKSLPYNNVELRLYGTGDMSSELENEQDSRIVFVGPRSNNEVVEAEIKSTILINPRPTEDEYTQYSFPSKTLEYMVSGTYTLTTKLAGIPNEYFDYCGAIEDYSAKGIKDALCLTLSISKEELHKKGMLAKRFVLENKNNVKQANRVIAFAHKLN